MHTMSIVYQPAPAAFPEMDMKGMVAMIVRVTPKKGEQFYLCNQMDEVIMARESGEPFVAHMVVGMMPKRVIIEPGSIARMEEV